MANTLLLMRHAKSSWSDNRLSDIERPLNQRGRLASVLMGQYLDELGATPDYVLLSPARRVQQTWKTIARVASVSNCTTSTDESLYGADPDGLIKVLSSVPELNSTVLMIGHQPDLSLFVKKLTGTSLDHFPTAALAKLQVFAPWSELNTNSCALDSFTAPKELV